MNFLVKNNYQSFFLIKVCSLFKHVKQFGRALDHRRSKKLRTAWITVLKRAAFRE